MPPLMFGRHFVNQLSEVHATTVPITERGRISRLCRLNRNEDILDASGQRLNEAQQRYMVCQHYFVLDFSFVDNNNNP